MIVLAVCVSVTVLILGLALLIKSKKRAEIDEILDIDEREF